MIFVLGGFRKGMTITVHNDVSQLTNYTESECSYMTKRSNGHGISFNATVRKVDVI